MLDINKRNMIIVTIIAFAFYQFINFIYFPIATTFPDEQRFLTEAITFANTGEFWIGNNRAWEMPLTAIVYGSIYKIANNIEYTIILIRIMQSLMLILQAFLIYKISLIIFKKSKVAFLSFIIMLFYPFFIYYQALLLSETLFTTILILSFYFMYKWYESGFIINKYFILTNVFLTFTIYSKGTLSILPPLLISIFYLLNTYNIKIFIKYFIYSILIYILIMSVWWLRNYYIFDKFIAFTTSSSMNLYLGANKNNKFGGINGRTNMEPEFRKRMNSLNNELRKSDEYKKRALEFILNNKDRYVELMWLKFKRFYSFTFNADRYNKVYYNLLSIFSYGLVFIFALTTVILMIKEWKKMSAIYILILYFTLIHILYIASIRYRFPIEHFLILLGAYSMIELNKIFKKK